MHLIVSHSPHIRSKQTVDFLMWNVVIALVPMLLVSVYLFGFPALTASLVGVLSCVAFEYLLNKYLLKDQINTVRDGSAALTGLLLAFNLPATIPIWMIILGSFIAIAVAKISFGGVGQNLFNPALVGRVFLLISFPVEMTQWPTNSLAAADAATAATPLMMLKEGLSFGKTIPEIQQVLPSITDVFLGNSGGCLGEVSAIALLLGFLYMLVRGIITWHIPIYVMGSLFALTGIMHLIDPLQYASPLFHLLSGGVVLGAVFMATDMVTSPMSRKGMLVFGCGIGIITALIRLFGSYPEGISFAILIMNGFVPLLNTYMKPRKFGA